jgi:hypothetical protein
MCCQSTLYTDEQQKDIRAEGRYIKKNAMAFFIQWVIIGNDTAGNPGWDFQITGTWGSSRNRVVVVEDSVLLSKKDIDERRFQEGKIFTRCVFFS